MPSKVEHGQQGARRPVAVAVRDPKGLIQDEPRELRCRTLRLNGPAGQEPHRMFRQHISTPSIFVAAARQRTKGTRRHPKKCLHLDMGMPCMRHRWGARCGQQAAPQGRTEAPRSPGTARGQAEVTTEVAHNEDRSKAQGPCPKPGEQYTCSSTRPQGCQWRACRVPCCRRGPAGGI